MSSKSLGTLKVKLKESPLFNLSLTNKELFHSNFLAWFGNTYNSEFKELINQLLGFNCWPEDLQSFSILREYKHFDICIKDADENPIILIENKVKSVPTKEQLDEYRNGVVSPSCQFILLTMTTNLQDLSKAKGWRIITYKNLSDKLSKVSLSDPYHSRLLSDYCKYIDNLQDVIETFDDEESYFTSNQSMMNELGIHDICGKRKAQNLYKMLIAECEKKGWTIVPDLQHLSSGKIRVAWGFTNSQALIEVQLKSGADCVHIQIQGKQYRHAVEFFDNKIGDRIKKEKEFVPSEKGIEYLSNHYSDILSLAPGGKKPINYPFEGDLTFGQNKNPGYCKYCNGRPDINGIISCFVYQWISIPEDTTCEDLVQKIIQDTEDIKKRRSL